MKLRYFLLLFSLILFSSIVFSYTIGFNYAEVRTTTNPVYAPYQYAYNYDTIDLRYSLYGSGITSPVNIVVSPKVYGVTLSGQRVFVHNMQTHSFMLGSGYPYTYSYNPMFYFDPNYQFYEVVLDVQDLDSTYQTNTSTYVYSQGSSGGNITPPSDPPSQTPTCDDFYLSGFSDIYLEEDKSDYYNLYIINSIDKQLTITSVTTEPSNPSRLDIQNIYHPYTISPFQTRSAQIDFFTDTVSSTYNDSFNIKVVGKYDNLTCEKNYSVNYRINNSSLPNTASCNDIRVLDKSFTLSSNENKNFDLEIENRSLDYYFEIDDVKLETNYNSIVDASLRSSIYRIFEDSKRDLKINLRSDFTNVNKTETVTLKIDGYLKRDNREDKRCRINESISVRVTPSSTTPSFNECNDIEIFTSDVSLKEESRESYSIANGFYIYNNSNKKFNITGINYTDNSIFTDIVSKSVDYSLFPKSSNSLEFDIRTSNVNKNETSKATISVQGTFENGASCTYSNIRSEFDIYVKEKEDACFNVGFNDGVYKNGDNLITIFNNTDEDFYVNDVIYQNRQNTNVNVVDKSLLVFKNSQKTIRVGASEVGSFELLLKGRFDNGASCDYTDTKKGYFRSFTDYSFSQPSCEYLFNYPNSKYVSLDGDFLNISFKNLTNKSGTIKISSVGAVIEDPIINFSGYQEISRKVDLVNIKDPRAVVYEIDIYGCEKTSHFTNIYPYSVDFQEEVSFVSYTSKIKSIDDRFVSSFTLKNNSSSNSQISVNFSGFPNDFTFVTSDFALNEELFTASQNKSVIDISGGNFSKNIYFGVMIPKTTSYDTYNGYIEILSSGKLILREPFTIDRSYQENPLVVNTSLERNQDVKNSVILTFDIENNLNLNRNFNLSFEDENSFVIEGVKDFSIDPFSKDTYVYSVEYLESPILKYTLLDKDTNEVVYQGEVDLSAVDKTPSFLTGFFTFANFKVALFWIILILLIVLVVYILYTRYHHKKMHRPEKLPLKKELNVIEKESFKEVREDLEKDSSTQLVQEEIIELPSKQITLRELDAGKNN